MKVTAILEEGHLFEGQEILAEEATFISEYIYELLDDVADMRGVMKSGSLPMKALPMINMTIDKMNIDLDDGEIEQMLEAVQRQFRRYGDKFLRQYRCTTGQKAGRLVTSPEKCGIRKDPRKVRQGKRSARMKKGIRVRKTLFTKRKTQSKRLSRLNKVLRGDRSKPKSSLKKAKTASKKAKGTKKAK